MTMPPLPVGVQSSLARFLDRFTQAEEERKRRAGIQQLPPVVITGEAPSPLGIPAARQELIERGMEPTSPEQAAREALTTSMQERTSAERKALAEAFARTIVDPRESYRAGRSAGERMRVGLQELGREGERVAGAKKVGTTTVETALNVLPAIGSAGAALTRIGGRMGPLRGLAAPAAGGVAGAATGYATAPEGEEGLRTILGGFGGSMLGYAGQRVAGMRQAAKVAASDPELAQALQTVRKDIDFTGKAAQAARPKSTESLVDKVMRQFVEGTRPIRKLGEQAEAKKLVRPSESPATRLNEAYDTPSRVKQALAGEGIVSPTTYKVIAPSYAEVFKPVNKSVRQTREALEYAYAKRVVGRGDEMALKMAGGDPEKLAAYKTVVERLGQRPDIVEFESRLNNFVNGLRQYAVDAGMWTPEMAERLAQSDALYIPFKRIIETTAGQPKVGQTLAGGRRVGRVSAQPRAMTGGMQAIENPAEALAEYAAKIIGRSDAHRLTDSIITTVERMGDAGVELLTPIARPSVTGEKAVEAARSRLMAQGMSKAEAMKAAEDLVDLGAPGFSKDNPVVWVLRNGEKQYFRINQPELYESMLALGRTHSEGIQSIVNALGPIKRTITLAATGINPRFVGGTNPARDIPDVIAKNPGAAQALPQGILDSVGEIFGGNRFAEELSRRGAGGASLWFVSQSPQAAQRLYAPTKAIDITSQIARVGGLPIRAAETAASTVERAPRFAAARAMFDRGMTDWQDYDDAMALAARAFNRGTVDFRLKPGSPMMQFLNDITPFLGASTKGATRYGEFVAEQPGRAAAQAALTMAGTTAEYMYSKRDDRQRYVDIIPQDRSRFLIFGDKRIPLGQEQAIVAAMTRYALAKLEQDDPDALAQLAVAVTNYLPPIDVPVVSQAIELARNKSYAGPIESKRLQALPTEERRYESTPATFTALARSPLIPGSPRQLEYLTRELIGPLTPAVTGVTEPIARRVLGKAAPLVEQRATSAKQLLPTAAFQQRRVPLTTSSETWYYGTREKANQQLTLLQRTLKGLPNVLASVDPANREDAVTAAREALDRAGVTGEGAKQAVAAFDFRITDKEFELLRDVESGIRSAPGVADEQKVQALDRLRALQQQRYRDARRRYQDIMAGKSPTPLSPIMPPAVP
jgi:hypothetical protein